MELVCVLISFLVHVAHSASPPVCPDGSMPHNCLVNPCDGKTCPDIPGATCVADYCGGCYAKFYLNGNEVTDICNELARCHPSTGNTECGGMCKPGTCPGHKICCPTDCAGGFDCLCPRDIPTPGCIGDPCDLNYCSNMPHVTCIPDYCGGCYARFYDGDDDVTDQCDIKPVSERCHTPTGNTECGGMCKPGICPGHKICCPTDCAGGFDCLCPRDIPTPGCIGDPCDLNYCSNMPHVTCIPDYCGGCYARFYDGDDDVTDQCDIKPVSERCHSPTGNTECGGMCKPGTCPGQKICCPTDCAGGFDCLCPRDMPQVLCAARPCNVNTCEKYPRARCEDDYCGGCYARFYSGADDVTEDCGCPDIRCIRSACSLEQCPRFPEAECIDVCGSCIAKFYVGDTDVTSRCNGLCEDGTLPVDCFMNPCEDPRAECPGVPDAECRPNYCGGCNRKWYSGDRDVTGDCNLCPDGSTPVMCLMNPCEEPGVACPQVPGAECRADYCGGCNRKWFSGDEDVTDRCEMPPPPPPHPECPVVVPDPLAFCADSCTANSCENGMICCPSSCGGKKCTCPSGSQYSRRCPTNPCRGRRCLNYPSATCSVDRCGCTAKFTLPSGCDVTSKCMHRPYSGPIRG